MHRDQQARHVGRRKPGALLLEPERSQLASFTLSRTKEVRGPRSLALQVCVCALRIHALDKERLRKRTCLGVCGSVTWECVDLRHQHTERHTLQSDKKHTHTHGEREREREREIKAVADTRAPRRPVGQPLHFSNGAKIVAQATSEPPKGRNLHTTAPRLTGLVIFTPYYMCMLFFRDVFVTSQTSARLNLNSTPLSSSAEPNEHTNRITRW